MTYEESVRYLLSLGRELASPQQARVTKFDLANITALCERLGRPERAFRAVHIAGTNGKGSTAAMLESILRAAGLRTSLYTSPHLDRINERIRLDGEEISDVEFAATFSRLAGVIEELLASRVLAAHPTFFECLTALAFEFFARSRAQFAVCEVGMGGRLDATNVLVPEVAVITQIDFDHENYLGHSIEAIAGEKAGVIKSSGRVVSAAENPVAREVIRRRATEQSASLMEIEDAFRLEDLSAENGRFSFTAIDAASGSRLPLTLSLAGRFQVRNALAAVAAARLLATRGAPIGDDAISRGIANTVWPGRLERIATNPEIYLDGMHNPAGAREIATFWERHLPGRNIHLVYAALRDKAVDEIAGLLFPQAQTVLFTAPPQSRALSAPVLAQMAGHHALRFEVIPSPREAFKRALELAMPGDVVFVAGSLYLVSELRRYWFSRAAAPAAQ